MGEELSTGSNSDLVASWVHEADGSIEGSMWQIERYLTAAHDQAGWAAAPTRAWLVNCRQKVAYTTPQI